MEDENTKSADCSEAINTNNTATEDNQCNEVKATPEENIPQTTESVSPKLSPKSASPKMPPRELLWKLRNFPTMFGKILESNVTFCVDTSGSMYVTLNCVKDHIIEALFQKAAENKDSHFNLIEFSSQVTQWSDKQVRLTPQTAAIAAQWIGNLQATTGTNVLDALLSAFSDPSCDAVYLITDGNPDQHPSEILDSIAYTSQNRPVHCFYIQMGDSDQASLEFLQDLAMETYGSFHVISVSQNGAIERIIPIYRAEATAERIIRTTQGNVYPSNHRVCSVTTTLDNPPNVILGRSPDVIVQEVDPWYPFLPYPYYGRYQYPGPYFMHYNYPYHGSWSKWRPAKAWSKFTQHLSDAAQVPPPAPGPGAMLIGTAVVARRNEDGYFYLGSVKSQILQDKFLVEFGPCKHGKYKDTSYQETYVYDLVSHTDALRHSVVVGDKVLAPWEPEGERYGPGIVIEGQEKRIADGGCEDSQLVVSFYNGKTATVPKDMAIWVPPQLYERIRFELQLPANVRQEFADQNHYPQSNLPGYPTSGPNADPQEFSRGEPKHVQQIVTDPFLLERGIYDNPYYVPMYPVYYKYQAKPCAVASEGLSEMVPGTDMTKSQLNEKVMSQLMQHKMTLEERREKEEEKQNEKLLGKREQIGENMLKKSVSFRTRDADELSDIEAEFYSGDLELKDSGHGSATDLEIENLEGTGEDEENGEKETRDIGVGTRSSKIRKRSASPSKPRWQYWRNDPAPELMDPMHYGPYRVGPYDATVAAAPLELRDHRIHKNEMDLATSMTDFVDRSIVDLQKSNATVKDSMGYIRIPRPPSCDRKPEKQGPGQPIYDVMGEHQREMDRVMEARREYRRQQCLAREKGMQLNREERYGMQQMMQDQHKQRILAQLDRERQRQIDERDKVARTREAKKRINTEIRVKIESNQERERAREDQRLQALQNRRNRREEILMQRQTELENIRARRQALKEQRNEDRCNAVNERLVNQEAMQAARDAQVRQAKLSRIQHFRRLEDNNQKMRELENQVRGHASSVFQSTIIS